MLTVKRYNYSSSNPKDLDFKIIITFLGIPIYVRYQYKNQISS